MCVFVCTSGTHYIEERCDEESKKRMHPNLPDFSSNGILCLADDLPRSPLLNLDDCVARNRRFTFSTRWRIPFSTRWTKLADYLTAGTQMFMGYLPSKTVFKSIQPIASSAITKPCYNCAMFFYLHADHFNPPEAVSKMLGGLPLQTCRVLRERLPPQCFIKRSQNKF